jgi:hypothetical protein
MCNFGWRGAIRVLVPLVFSFYSLSPHYRVVGGGFETKRT